MTITCYCSLAIRRTDKNCVCVYDWGLNSRGFALVKHSTT
jgi:hypothetical protein